uniref:BZIP domain-containing protein n=2 Tax=Bursaphelenchus xylophilus TaxID=6326 RepID=A0A1I7S1G2_BURXY
MDESMEPGPSRCDPNTDSPSIEVSKENELREKRKKGLEKARAKLEQRKQRKIKLAESRWKIARQRRLARPSPPESPTPPVLPQPSEVEVLKKQLVQLTQENTQLRLRNSELEKKLERAESASALNSPTKRKNIDELGLNMKQH